MVPNEIERFTNASIECTSEYGPFNLIETFLCSDPSYRFPSYVKCNIGTFCSKLLFNTSINDATTDLLSMKALVFNLLIQLLIETGTIWRTLLTSLLWLIVAALGLTDVLPSNIWFSDCSNRLLFGTSNYTKNVIIGIFDFMFLPQTSLP